MYTVLILCFLVPPALSAVGFSWTDCSTNPNKAILIDQINLTPSPVVIPGNIGLTLKGKLIRTVQHVNLKISIKRSTLILDVPIPCLFHVGSCTYNLCTMLNTMIADNWVGEAANMANQVETMLETQTINGTHCPWGPGHMDVRDYTLVLPNVPSVLSWFAAGDYKVRIQTFDTDNNDEELLCIDATVSAAQPQSSGFLFG